MVATAVATIAMIRLFPADSIRFAVGGDGSIPLK